MKQKLFFGCLALVGLINFLPVLGLFSLAQMSQAYGVEFTQAEWGILMRHRALLFGLLGGFVLASLFKPAWQAPALFMASLSMLGFMGLAWPVAALNAGLAKIFWIDLIGLVLAALAWLLWWSSKRDHTA
ncbi:hypothetical protein [Marinicella meishanensis]|uniref:hypothetical protein n=1 Tax=Marinicella meishanensis TaxID=2873263 RepID=UPI001CBC4738|nr:hypothetical protein [Marinicella sp. NBU2979]